MMTVGVSFSAQSGEPVAQSGVSSAHATNSTENPPRVLAFGDSLTAGYHLDPEQAFPALLERRLQKDWGKKVQVINGGVSGDTAAQGLRRLNWTLRQGPFQVVILCLGANDGLRQQSVSSMEASLRALIEAFLKTSTRVILVGVKLPQNIDAEYRRTFEKVFPKLAKEYRLAYLPFLLEGVATEKNLNLPDGIHPNEKGHAVIATSLYPLVKSELIKSTPVAGNKKDDKGPSSSPLRSVE